MCQSWKPPSSISAFHTLTRSLFLKRPEGGLPQLKFAPEVPTLALAALALDEPMLAILRKDYKEQADMVEASMQLWSQHVDPAAPPEALEDTFQCLLDIGGLPPSKLASTLELYLSTGWSRAHECSCIHCITSLPALATGCCMLERSLHTLINLSGARSGESSIMISSSSRVNFLRK